MPDEISGLPLHPLVVHAAVVFTPLAALAAIAFALMPRWRYVLRFPTAALVVVSFLSLWISKISGPEFQDHLGLPNEAIETHEDRADTLFLLAIVFLVVAAVAIWLLGFARVNVPVPAQWAVSLVFTASAVLVLVWVVLTGDAGARAAWGT